MAGIRWCPPDQSQGSWIDRSKMRDFASSLKTYGMDDYRAAMVAVKKVVDAGPYLG